jgi:hypothetical protein
MKVFVLVLGWLLSGEIVFFLGIAYDICDPGMEDKLANDRCLWGFLLCNKRTCTCYKL